MNVHRWRSIRFCVEDDRSRWSFLRKGFKIFLDKYALVNIVYYNEVVSMMWVTTIKWLAQCTQGTAVILNKQRPKIVLLRASLVSVLPQLLPLGDLASQPFPFSPVSCSPSPLLWKVALAGSAMHHRAHDGISRCDRVFVASRSTSSCDSGWSLPV